MSHSSITAFDSTVQITNTWIHELMEELGWDDRHRAYSALRVVLHALRDRLTINEVAALGAQLPMLVRGFYYEGWQPEGKPLKERKKQEFLSHIGSALRDEDGVDSEKVARAVFYVLAKHVTGGALEHVKSVLPRELWPLLVS